MRADWITNCDTAGGFVTDWVSTSAWVMTLIGVFGRPPHVAIALGFPSYAVAIGCTIGLISAIGSGICHRELNKKNQLNRAINQSTPESLSTYHQAALALDAVVHTAETAALPSTLLQFAGVELSSLAKGGILLGFIPVAVLAAISEIRICRNALQNNNHSVSESKLADWITNFATGAKGVTSWLSTASLLATFMNACSGPVGRMVLGFPLYALIVASITALILAMGAAYSHWVLGIMNQNQGNHHEQRIPLLAAIPAPRPQIPLRPYQWAALFANTVVNAANLAAIPGLLIELASRQSTISPIYRALGIGCFFAPAVLTGLADTRNCRTAIFNYNQG